MTAQDVIKLLQKKHSDDLFFDQCKTGGTWNGSKLLILDAIAIKPTFSPTTVIGYEIKVSRSDFMNDNKWQGYLPYCNEFYFVAPKGLILPNELPPEVGLLTTAGGRPQTAKKATRREVAIPNDLWVYILLHRMDIRSEKPVVKADKAAFWRNWLVEKKIDHDLGWRVSKALRQQIDGELQTAQEKARRVEVELKKLKEIKQVADELGIDWYTSTGTVKDRLEKKKRLVETAIPEGVVNNIAAAIQNLSVVHTLLKQEGF